MKATVEFVVRCEVVLPEQEKEVTLFKLNSEATREARNAISLPPAAHIQSARVVEFSWEESE